MQTNIKSAYEPHPAKIIERYDESKTIFTLRLEFTDKLIHEKFSYAPGQFNMLYLYGVGEIAISIVSDSLSDKLFDHTIRVVGRVTKGFAQLKQGDTIGVRGPFGNSWPLEKAKNKDILIIVGGLGCAPVVSVINTLFKHREDFNRVFILQGVKHSDDFIFKERFAKWAKYPDTQVLIAADAIDKHWPWYRGTAVDLLSKLEKFNVQNTLTMMCGPEIMMHFAAKALIERGMAQTSIYLSMERNMQCGVGHCGHCQLGPYFICKDGPIFNYATIQPLFNREGF